MEKKGKKGKACWNSRKRQLLFRNLVNIPLWSSFPPAPLESRNCRTIRLWGMQQSFSTQGVKQIIHDFQSVLGGNAFLLWSLTLSNIRWFTQLCLILELISWGWFSEFFCLQPDLYSLEWITRIWKKPDRVSAPSWALLGNPPLPTQSQ